MLVFPNQISIYISIEPVDFRCGIDGLKQLCKQQFKQDPFSGAIFVFRNSRHYSIKILWYDGQGFALFLKRLSRGKFYWWPNTDEQLYVALAQEAQVLLHNGNPATANFQIPWKFINQAALDDGS